MMCHARMKVNHYKYLDVRCYGKSTTLKLNSRPKEDAELIYRTLRYAIN